ncbi:hypothetical protein FACS18949_02630 [Clostridia bacterium]|nr:hypothetical protein FACS18949_02630 [Clostridia bacterium]
MIIQGSSVALKGYSDYQRTDVTSFSKTTQTSAAVRQLERDNTLKARQQDFMQQQARQQADTASFSAEGLKKASAVTPLLESLSDPKEELKIQLLKAMLEQLSNIDGDFGKLQETLQARLKAVQQSQMQHLGGQFALPAMTTVETTRLTSETYISNSMSFNAKASVRTADGREINVDIQLNMSQEYYQRTEAQFTKAFQDPLVINLNTASASLSDRKFSFDLDMDGTSDQISQLARGSGFLALDKNGDGKINDGSELFGAKTGDGFKELAQYDSDRNGWIDEADAIFDKLRIWSRNDDGTSTLIGLGQAGVGAIFLGSAAGNYLLGALDNPDGAIRSTGMFLFEDGRAGTVQHVDLAA